MRRYLLLVAAALAAFGDCLRGSFHFDDYTMLAAPAGPPWRLQTRPLTQLTFWLNSQAGGGYHLVNLALHVTVVCLAFRVLRDLISEEAAFLAAALFAIHPIQSEAVAYVFARGTLLATLFCLLCWKAWREGRPWFAAGFFAAALLSKEECVTFPFVLLLFGPRYWKPFGAMAGLAAATGLRTLYITHAVAGSGAGFSAGIAPLNYFAAQGSVILRYARLFFIPWGFTVDPDIHPAAWAWPVVIAAIVLLRRSRWLLAGLILLIPSSSIFPAADLSADRRMYLPMVAFCAAAGRIANKRFWPIAIVLIALSAGRMEVWRDERTLWSEAVERSPDKTRPRIQLARAVPPEEALQVLNPLPATPDVIAERGRVYLDLGQPALALREFGQALAMRPGDPHAINNRGAALLALGQREAARKDFERALKIDPALREAAQNLSRATAAAK